MAQIGCTSERSRWSRSIARADCWKKNFSPLKSEVAHDEPGLRKPHARLVQRLSIGPRHPVGTERQVGPALVPSVVEEGLLPGEPEAAQSQPVAGQAADHRRRGLAGDEAVGVAIVREVVRHGRGSQVAVHTADHHVPCLALGQDFARRLQCDEPAGPAVGDDAGAGRGRDLRDLADHAGEGGGIRHRAAGAVLLGEAEDQRGVCLGPGRARQRLDDRPCRHVRHALHADPVPRQRHRAADQPLACCTEEPRLAEPVEPRPHRRAGRGCVEADRRDHSAGEDVERGGHASSPGPSTLSSRVATSRM